MNHLLRGARQGAALVALVGALFASNAALAAQPAPGGSSTTYSGRALAVRIDGVTHPVSGPIIVCDTGALPPTGGALQVSQSNVNIGNGGLTIDSVFARTSGGGPEAASLTTLSGYRVEFLTDEGEHIIIEADYIQSQASASADKHGRITTSADVNIQNLRVNGQAVAVTGRPNQIVQIGADCRLFINEQTNAGSANSGDIAVAAIRFELCHCIFGSLGVVQAGITVNGTPPPVEEDCGKVTGGGWIIGTPSGAKGTFGMSGGIRRGEFWGHLTYQDHGTGMKVQSTAVTGFRNDPSDPKGRIINYNVTINGAPGTATLRVVDNGEPGRNDIFDLTLSTGYHAAGDLGGGRPGGGNIQLHKCPPGWQ